MVPYTDAPANYTGIRTAAGTICCTPHTAILVNPLCAKRFHRRYIAGDRHYSTGTIGGPLLYTTPTGNVILVLY